MIPMTSFGEKSDQASRFFVLTKLKLTPLQPGPPGRGIPFCFFEYRRRSAGLLSGRLSEAPSLLLTRLSNPCTVVSRVKSANLEKPQISVCDFSTSLQIGVGSRFAEAA